jgi:hypothetical protein
MEDNALEAQEPLSPAKLLDVLRVITILQAEGVIAGYALCGAVATLFYTEAVATYDIDIYAFIPSTGLLVDLSHLYGWARRHGFSPQGEHIIIHEVPVQFLPSADALTDEAIKQARTFTVGDVEIRVMAAEHLAALALATHRSGKDYERVNRLIDSGHVNLPRLEEIIQQFNLTSWWQEYRRRYE